jgi:cell division protein FtsB
MRGRREKRQDSGRRRWLAAGLSLLLVVFLISTLFGKKGILEIRRARKGYQSLLLEKQRLEEQRLMLQREIKALQENPQAVEREAREKLWLMRPDEIVIVNPQK